MPSVASARVQRPPLHPDDDAPAVPRAVPMPARFTPAECETLLRWAAEAKLSYEQLSYAIDRVRGWAESRPRAPLCRSWVRQVENAMRDGWALRGYREHRQRTATTINPRTGSLLMPETPISEALIQRHVERSRRAWAREAST